MKNQSINNQNNQSKLLIFVLTGVWLVLLALCALIGSFIVPIEISTTNYAIIVGLGAVKVFVSLIMILIWLIGWYKVIQVILLLELYAGQSNSDSINGQNMS